MSAPRRAVVRTAVAPLLAEPRASGAQLSQRLAGHWIDIVETRGDWLRVRGEDGYEGWTHAGYLSLIADGEELRRNEPVRLSLGCRVRAPEGTRRSLPLGACLAAPEVVEWGEAVAETELPARFPCTPPAIAHSALTHFEGASYQWGGITPWGADCSGFVQTLFRLHGISLPRDAWQQGECGVTGSARLADLRAAELAFFSDRDDGRITHVGVGVGEARMAHVAIGRGGFAVERLSGMSDGYVAKLHERFRLARWVVTPAS